MLNIILFGPPGSGKGTQAAKLKEKYNLVHLSTGDIFRANIEAKTELGNLAQGFMDKGHLVPDDITINMLQLEVEKAGAVNGIIYDGFPRTVSQAASLDKFLNAKGTPVSVVLSLEVADEEVTTRLIKRAKDSGRPDDADPAIIAKRLDVYKEQTFPCLDYFQPSGKVYRLDGVGSIDGIFNRLCETIDGVHA